MTQHIFFTNGTVCQTILLAADFPQLRNRYFTTVNHPTINLLSFRHCSISRVKVRIHYVLKKKERKENKKSKKTPHKNRIFATESDQVKGEKISLLNTSLITAKWCSVGGGKKKSVLPMDRKGDSEKKSRQKEKI